MRLIIATLLAAMPAFSQQDTLALIAPTTVVRGQTADIQVRRTTAPPPPVSSGQQVTIQATGGIASVTAEPGAAGTAAGKQVICGVVVLNKLNCIFFGFNQTVPVDGIVAILHVRTTTNAPTNIDFTISSAVAALPNGDNAPAVPGPTVSVSVLPSKCDIDADGQISPADVTAAVNQAISGTGGLGPSADMDGNGKVDIRDVQWIAAALPPPAGTGICR